MLSLIAYITNHVVEPESSWKYLGLIFNLNAKVREPRSRAQWLTIVGNVAKDQQMIQNLVPDTIVLKIVI